jgi:hypothetical protein
MMVRGLIVSVLQYVGKEQTKQNPLMESGAEAKVLASFKGRRREYSS